MHGESSGRRIAHEALSLSLTHSLLPSLFPSLFLSLRLSVSLSIGSPCVVHVPRCVHGCFTSEKHSPGSRAARLHAINTPPLETPLGDSSRLKFRCRAPFLCPVNGQRFFTSDSVCLACPRCLCVLSLCGKESSAARRVSVGQREIAKWNNIKENGGAVGGADPPQQTQVSFPLFAGRTVCRSNSPFPLAEPTRSLANRYSPAYNVFCIVPIEVLGPSRQPREMADAR